MDGNYKGRGTVLVVTEKTGSTPNYTIGQICGARKLLFSGSGRFASRADAACDNMVVLQLLHHGGNEHFDNPSVAVSRG